jgi:hypothetical protein
MKSILEQAAQKIYRPMREQVTKDWRTLTYVFIVVAKPALVVQW